MTSIGIEPFAPLLRGAMTLEGLVVSALIRWPTGWFRFEARLARDSEDPTTASAADGA